MRSASSRTRCGSKARGPLATDRVVRELELLQCGAGLQHQPAAHLRVDVLLHHFEHVLHADVAQHLHALHTRVSCLCVVPRSVCRARLIVPTTTWWVAAVSPADGAAAAADTATRLVVVLVCCVVLATHQTVQRGGQAGQDQTATCLRGAGVREAAARDLPPRHASNQEAAVQAYERSRVGEVSEKQRAQHKGSA